MGLRLKFIWLAVLWTVTMVLRRRPGAGLLQRFYDCLGALLNRPPGALTIIDVEQDLASRGVSSDAIDDLRAVFESCEAARYGAGSAGDRETRWP